MPKTTTRYRVFLASPSDLEMERESINDVIHELNQTFGNDNNLIIELMRWETHSASGISSDGTQELINQDIQDEYDLFIGMMWMRFGTPTKVANSGTEEEFKRALKKYKQNPNKTQIMFYFKNSLPKKLSDIDTNELEKVNQFKNSIAKEGVLYWSFQTTSELHENLRKHIRLRILDLVKNQNTRTETGSNNQIDNEVFIDDDYGLIDLNELIASKFELATGSLLKIISSTEWIGSEISEKANEIQKVNKSDYKAIKTFVRKTADSMNDYALELKIQTIAYSQSFNEGLNAMFKLIDIVEDFHNENTKNDLSDIQNTIQVISVNMKSSLINIEKFKDSVNGLPRIDVSINKAKKKVSSSLTDFINTTIPHIELSDKLLLNIEGKMNNLS